MLAALGSSFSGPDRRPALFREFLPAWFAVSRRILFDGRTDDAMGRSDTELAEAFAVAGVLDLDAEGIDEALIAVAPFVWMSVGADLFSLFAPLVCTATGAMVAAPAAAGSNVPAPASFAPCVDDTCYIAISDIDRLIRRVRGHSVR